MVLFGGRLIAAYSIAGLFLLQLPAADWPNFRGAKVDGISTETGLLKQWPAGGPPLAWTATGIGDGYTGVSVVGNRVYTAGDKGDAGFVHALNLQDGKILWSAKLGKSGAPGWGGFAGPRATPSIAGDLLFMVDQWGELVCLDANDGKEKWRKHFKEDFGGDRPEWGFSESPLVDGDKVIVTPGGSKGAVVALNQKNGAVIWQSKDFTDEAHYSSLVPVELGGVRQYVQLTAKSVAGIAAADGRLLWKAARKGATAVIPTPICSDNLVYVTSGYGIGCHLFKVSGSGGQFNAEQVYANKVMVNHHGGVILFEGNVYGYSDGKGWTCQDFKSGEAKWQEKQKLGKGAIAYADGRFYLREEKKGTLVLIEASSAGYKEAGRFEQPNRSKKDAWPHPVVAQGKLFIRDQDVLLCYDVKAK